ncbi:MAG: efflux RND transporter periplasmic adaptor subunit [Candidatus Moraniibacteriota bacterium]
MKKILIPLIIALALIAFWGYKKTDSQIPSTTVEEKTALPVGVQAIEDSFTLKKTLLFPGTVIGKDEARITAKSNGTIRSLYFDLGSSVSTGQLLSRIDDTGNNLEAGKNNLQSATVQQLEQAKLQAKRSLISAEKDYKNDSTVANRMARDIAKSQLETAEINLASALDNHLITAPISGKISAKNVSLGDSVSIGQQIATISKTGKIKVQFFANQEQFSHFSIGLTVNLIDNSENVFSAKVTNISPVADSATKKFLIEAEPNEKTALLSGTIINISLEISDSPQKNGNILLPLSAITVGQNESYLFIVEGEKAKKTNIGIANISGEIAEVKLDLPESTQIIVSGNKSLKDSDAVEVKK